MGAQHLVHRAEGVVEGSLHEDLPQRLDHQHLAAGVARGFRGPTIQGRSAVFNSAFTTADSETITSGEIRIDGAERTARPSEGRPTLGTTTVIVAVTSNPPVGEALGLEACFFVLIRTTEHDADWAARFLAAVRARPEVIEAHRLAGDIDYILKVMVKNARAYDRFYQSLIAEVRIQNVTALLSMEEMKATSALPIPPA